MFIERSQVEAALPRYELGRELGSGASGVVLEARHRQITRRVAVKVLTRAGDRARAGFRREADVLAGLDHPHIVRIYDYVEHGDLSMLIMEHLPGGTLRTRLARTTPAAACAVGLAAADALAAAHTAGVLHRDVKPANILFALDDAPKLVDFGISRYFGGSATSAESIAGTPGYMAPEQMGGRVGPGTDLYALGVVLYRLLSGRMPIDPALPVAEVWQRQLAGPLPPPVGVAAPLAAVIVQALEQSRADRQPSARAFAHQLAEAAAAVFGPGWLAASGITVRAARDILDAAEPPPSEPAPPVPPTRTSVTVTSQPQAPSPPTTPPPAPTSRPRSPTSPQNLPTPPPSPATPLPNPVPVPPTGPVRRAPDPLTERTRSAESWLSRPSADRFAPSTNNQASPSPVGLFPPTADRASPTWTGRAGPLSATGPSAGSPTSAQQAQQAQQAQPAQVPAGGAVVLPPVRNTGDGALVISTVTDIAPGRRLGARRSLMVAVAAGLAALVVAAVVALRPDGSADGGRKDLGSPGGADAQPTVTSQVGSAVGPGIRLVDDATTGADGAGAVITALAVADDGVQVAVGRRATSLALPGPIGTRPAAWLCQDGQRWLAVTLPLPPATRSGTVLAVAFLAGRGFVAVGTAVTGPSPTAGQAAGAASDMPARPALWRSADGRSWEVLATAGGLTGEVTGLVTHDGGLLAVGRSGDALGDGAVWRSAEGTSWTHLSTPSLGGPAEQHVDQVVELADGSLLAAGSELSGSATVTRLRYSPDATSWRLAPKALPPGVLVHALARLPDGRVLAAGSIAGNGSTFERPAVLVGSRTGEDWTIHPVTTARHAHLLGAAVIDGALLLTGADAATDTSEPTAGLWSIPPPGS